MTNVQLHRDKKNTPWVIPAPYIKPYNTREDLVLLFVKMVTVFNGIEMGFRELEFITFMLLRDGTISQLGRRVYREKYKISRSVVDTMINRLKKKGILIGERDTLKVHPKIVLNFKDDNYIFQFKCLKK